MPTRRALSPRRKNILTTRDGAREGDGGHVAKPFQGAGICSPQRSSRTFSGDVFDTVV